MRKLYIVGLIAVAALVIGIAIADEIKFSTYYPAPYGKYREFDTTGKTCLATDEWGIEGANARVGIGTTNPDEKLRVEGNIKLNDGEIIFRESGGPSLGGHIVGNATGVGGWAGTYITIGSASDWDVYRDELTITNGNVGIGTVSPKVKLSIEEKVGIGDPSHVDWDTWGTGLLFASAGSGGSLDTSGAGIFGVQQGNWGSDIVLATQASGGGGGNARLTVRTNGDVVGQYGSWTSSDVRFKKDIITVPDALEKVMALRGVNFSWKYPDRDDGKIHMGMVAQEVEKVVPEVVRTADDEMKTKSVEYQLMVGLLVEAIKEQQKEIEVLKAKLNKI